MRKQEVLTLLDYLPDSLDPELLMHELYLKAKIERAEEAMARGEIVVHSESASLDHRGDSRWTRSASDPEISKSVI